MKLFRILFALWLALVSPTLATAQNDPCVMPAPERPTVLVTNEDGACFFKARVAILMTAAERKPERAGSRRATAKRGEEATDPDGFASIEIACCIAHTPSPFEAAATGCASSRRR